MRLMLSVCLAALALPANAAEEVVRITTDRGVVVGTLETPDGDPAPVALLLHGFTGTRDELGVKDTEEGVFSRAARLLAESGWASLRIDFRGSGDSDGAWEDTTLKGQIADADAAIAWLRADERVDGDHISVIGWSQGGLVAAHAAAANDDVQATVLWAPVVSPLHAYEPLLGAESFAKALEADAEEVIAAELPWGAEVKLKARFYHEVPLSSTTAAVAQYDGPLKVIMAMNDTVIVPQPASGQVLVDYHDGPEALTFLDTDHVWGAFSGPDVIDSKLMPETLDWLNQHGR